MKKIMILIVLVFVVLGLAAGPCLAAAADTAGKAAEKAKAPAPAEKAKAAPAEKAKAPAPAEKAKAAPTEKAAPKAAPLKSPVIKLYRVEIASYWGWIDPAKSPTPLVLAFVFALENPNKKVVMLDDLKFTVAFEDFEVNTVMYYDDNYIPGEKTDYLRVNVVLDSGVTNGMLLVSRGHTLIGMIERKEITKSTDLLEKWWKGVGDFSFRIGVNGMATFVGPGDKIIRVPFEGVFPKK